MSKQTKKAGIILGMVGVVIIILMVALGTGLLGTATSGLRSDHLFVDATYLLKTEETNDTVNVTCTIYLTNTWDKASGDLKAIAYIIETNNNLAVFKNTVEIGKIAGDSTAEIEIPVVLSNNSYKVDILLFEDDKLVIKGQITISAHPVYIWDDISLEPKQTWTITNGAGSFYQVP